MIRLFVGIDLPEDIKESLYSLHGGLIGAKWRETDRMHITLRFIGNVDEQTADEIIRELRYLRFPAFHLTAKGLGYFDVPLFENFEIEYLDLCNNNYNHCMYQNLLNLHCKYITENNYYNYYQKFL